MGLFKSGKKDEDFIISSRSLAFRKRVWEELGGYPEWLNYSEDMYFHERIRRSDFRIIFAKDAIVEWSQRKNLKQIFRQFFLYMEGDGMAKMHTARHLIRFVVYSCGLVLLFLARANPVFFIPLLGGCILYISGPFKNFRKLRKYRLFGKPLIIIPFLLLMVDIAKMVGYLSGIIKGKDYFIGGT
jgi:hypothetical protein